METLKMAHPSHVSTLMQGILTSDLNNGLKVWVKVDIFNSFPLESLNIHIFYFELLRIKQIEARDPVKNAKKAVRPYFEYSNRRWSEKGSATNGIIITEIINFSGMSVVYIKPTADTAAKTFIRPAKSPAKNEGSRTM
ncbi:hypothetical protein [Rothia nasimurium]|uniref:hypothetical protein n=1 Tax=Rothia nasimurium TaxID=85336 RepID=UPI001F17BC06|nr:hypothetical protein [Rothia nasimurium]